MVLFGLSSFVRLFTVLLLEPGAGQPRRESRQWLPKTSRGQTRPGPTAGTSTKTNGGQIRLPAKAESQNKKPRRKKSCGVASCEISSEPRSINNRRSADCRHA